jgi:hypothetical protein
MNKTVHKHDVKTLNHVEIEILFCTSCKQTIDPQQKEKGGSYFDKFGLENAFTSTVHNINQTEPKTFPVFIFGVLQ